MAIIGVEQLRKGMKLKIDGTPFAVTDFQFTKPGKGQAVYKCKLKSLTAGNSFERTWRSGESVEKADLATKELFFSYIDDNAFVFSDPETYEEVRLAKDVVGDKRHYLTDDCNVEITFCASTFIS